MTTPEGVLVDRTVYEKRLGTITVETYADGWKIRGSEMKSHNAPTWAPPVSRPFEADIMRCQCGKPYFRGTNQYGQAVYKKGHCDGWHVERVERLVKDIVQTYGRTK